MLFGQAAIEKLVAEHPTAHKWFGAHKSIEHFAITISTPAWLVVETNEKWLIGERVDFTTLSVHWFCPGGFHRAALVSLLDAAFESTGVSKVIGEVPNGHPNARAARLVNRALGAEKVGTFYVLTLGQHRAYNHTDPKHKD